MVDLKGKTTEQANDIIQRAINEILEKLKILESRIYKLEHP
jgi:ferritin-like protein